LLICWWQNMSDRDNRQEEDADEPMKKVTAFAVLPYY
jgi:hypothetical protein